MRIDAHQHFWHYSAAAFPWIGANMQRLARDYLPADLAPELQQSGIDGCIAVQARADAQENDFLLELAAANPFVRGVVGWTDLCAPDAADVVAALAQHPKLRGLRHLVQDEADDAFVLRADFQRGVASLAAHALVYDVLIHPRHLPAAVRFTAALPEVTFVLDHLAKPQIRAARREPWERDLRALAEQPHVACKLSGLVTEATWHDWRNDDFRFYLDTALDAFGPQRLLFGSDWPVCLLGAADYRAVHDLVATWAQTLSASERNALFGDNAARIYRIP